MTADRQASGIVFNIQKYSVNDGPGIRTTVFFKGCPLRCRWCANPESQSSAVQVLWDASKCLDCLRCVSLCPNRAVSREGGRIRIDPAACGLCGNCVRECPGRALKTEGMRMTVSEVLCIVRQDLPFYEESGGGMTVSGGEAMAQPHFVRQLLLGAKEDGLHTCCETTGFAMPDVFEGILSLLDCVLFDMKHWDAEAHCQGTGVTNELPLQNLKLANRSGKDVLPRIPVIPGYNDSAADAEGFVRRLTEAGSSRCQLLPFHQFGENKYDLLGTPYAYRDVPALHREDLEPYRQIFLSHGIDAYF